MYSKVIYTLLMTFLVALGNDWILFGKEAAEMNVELGKRALSGKVIFACVEVVFLCVIFRLACFFFYAR